jgi:PAS domain S-box-containing protein
VVGNMKSGSDTRRDIQNAREFAESIIDTIHEPLIVLDAELRVISASLSFYQTFKVNPKETEGQFIYDLGNHQWNIPKLHELLENILPQSSTFNKFEVEHEFIGIGKRTMLLNARQILGTSEKSRIILLAIEDITERKLIAQEVQDARELAENIINTIHEPLIILDEDLRVISASLSFYQTFKVNPKETVGQYIYDLGNHQWDIPKLRELLENILPESTTFNKFEVEHEFIEIGKRTMLLNARQILRPFEKSKIILLAIEDITERRIAEFAASIIDTIHEPLIILDSELRVVSASVSFYQTFKVNPKETEGQFIYDLGNHQWDIPQLRELLESILPYSTNFDNFKVEHDFIDIGKRTILLNARRIPAPPEKPRLILLAIKDITEHLQAQSFKKAGEIAESIIDTIREPLIVLDTNMRVISANRSFYQTFKVTPQETEGQYLYKLGDHQWDIPQLRILLDDIIASNTSFDNFEVKRDFLTIGSKIMWLNARRIIPDDGETKLILLSLEDVSKRRQAEDEFNRIFKAKSTFTSMVSHELRTPLTSLKQSINLLVKGKVGPLNPEQKKFLDIAERNLDRLVNLINNVLDFQKLESGKMTYKMEKNDINAAIKEIKEMMLSLITKKNLDFIVETEENLPETEFDKDKIIQVLTNLVNNALNATEKGYIKVTTTQTEHFIQVSVQDTGSGIKQEDMPKLFQEYEQLERKGGGTGLGLVISQDIILAHSGKMWAESIFGKGTTIHFVLPINTARKKVVL